MIKMIVQMLSCGVFLMAMAVTMNHYNLPPWITMMNCSATLAVLMSLIMARS